VQYDDWKGTVAWDEPDQMEALHDLLGIDRGSWHIVAMHIWGGRVGSGDLTSGVFAYAIPASAGNTFEEIVAAGELEVTEFQVRSENAALQLFEHVFKRWGIHATSKGFLERGIPFKVVDRVDLYDGEADDEPL
jgi:hypothetical protein